MKKYQGKTAGMWFVVWQDRYGTGVMGHLVDGHWLPHLFKTKSAADRAAIRMEEDSNSPIRAYGAQLRRGGKLVLVKGVWKVR